MKKLVVITVVVLVAGIAYFNLASHRHGILQARGTSQIFIHGTPVCVTQDDEGDIVATVGECLRAGPDQGQDQGQDQGKDEDENPGQFHGGNDLRLPPGHPPIGEDMDLGGQRRILI